MTAHQPTLGFRASVRLGTFSLDAAFESAPGVTALFGPSGAGKTTILNLVAGLVRPDQGRIAFGDTVFVDTERGIFMPPRKRRCGVVFQDAQLFPHLTVGQNIAFGRWFARDRRVIDQDSVVRLLGIAALLDRWPARLSGGEKQRVAVARALLSSPDLLLMDEPLSGLADAMRFEILPLIERMRDEFSIPILYVTHRPDEVRRLASHVVKIERGRVVATGSPSAILDA